MIRQVQGRIHLFLSGVRVTALPYSRILGQGYHRAQVGKSWPGIPFTQISLEGIAGCPSQTMRREGIASSQLLLFISSHDDFLFINGEARYSHQRPGAMGASWAGYSAEERFLGHLCGRRWVAAIHAFEVILGSE